eukprot:m.149478 g.149478  ORF g.149478 m.149478 type:complete len:149 (+) comp23251_c0_seq1:2371-2817(+)
MAASHVAAVVALCCVVVATVDGFNVKSRVLVDGEPTVVQRDCKVVRLQDELQGIASDDANGDWLKGSKWKWNGWGEVTLTANGYFVAPQFQEACKTSGVKECTWKESGGRVVVNFGNAGQHTLTPSADKRRLTGARDSDGDPVVADRV